MAEAPAANNKDLRMSYKIGRGETGVLTFEPYKSFLLPKWRFRTPSIAAESAAALYKEFLEYDSKNDFVGMDMTRKFIQMGMTRAQRYANYSSGRKYSHDVDKGKVQRARSDGHKGQEDKLEASRIFREVWNKCRAHEGYQKKKVSFMKERKKT